MYILCLTILSCLLFHPLSSLEHGSTLHYPVGDLGEKWQFPSDHLPIGAQVGEAHIAMWNVLDTRYLYHIHVNHQGLKNSLITAANVPVDLFSKLTVRESLIVDMVLEMVWHPENPRNLIALQEVGEEVLIELKRRLPKRMVCLTTFDGNLANGDLFIYDSSVFDQVSLRSDYYRVRPRNTMMTLTLLAKESGRLYHFVQSHIPGGPVASVPARKEFAEELLLNFDPGATTVVMGDMNRSPDFFMKDLKELSEEFGMEHPPFANLWVPYPTHIDTHKRASWIDNFFIYTNENGLPVEVVKDSNALCWHLNGVVELLKGLRPHLLDLSFELWSQITVNGIAVVNGVVGMEESGQIDEAFKEKRVVELDLRKIFLEDYFRKNGIYSKEEMSLIRYKYVSEKGFAKHECNWIEDNKKHLMDSLLEKGAEVAIFNHFDFTTDTILSGDKLQSVLKLIDIAQQVSQKGVKVIFVVHQASSSCNELWESLFEKFAYCRSNLIESGYLSEFEENALLSNTQLSVEEKESFRMWAHGVPSAYFSMIRTQSFDEEFNYENVCKKAWDSLECVWNEVQDLESLSVQKTLINVANEEIEIDEIVHFPEFYRLVETGLIGKIQGKWLMPSMVREFLQSRV